MVTRHFSPNAMHSTRREFLAACLALPACAQTPAIAPTDHAAARSAFLRAVAEARKPDRAAVAVDPPEPHGEPYAGLRTGDFHAFWATNRRSGATLARGFATADGRVAFFRTKVEGQTSGDLGALLAAARVNEPRARPSAREMAERLLWCLGEGQSAVTGTLYDGKTIASSGWTAPDGPTEPSWQPQPEGAELRFATMTQGLTGSWAFHRVTVTFAHNHRLLVRRAPLP